MDIMMVGDTMVPMDDDLRAVKHTSDTLMQAADIDGTSVTAVIAKGNHSLTTVNATPVQAVADLAHLTEQISTTLEKSNEEMLNIVGEVLERKNNDN